MQRLRDIGSFLKQRVGLPPPLVTMELAGRRLLVRQGAIRETPDYDDAWLLACAQRAKVVFDVGANVGQAALIILMSDSIEHLVLIEANPVALAVAAENLIRNRLSAKANFVWAFASSVLGEDVTLWTVGTGSAGSRYQTHAKTAASKKSSLDVVSVTLDYLSDMYGIVPDLVKIDVEGAEYDVLQGSRGIASKAQARFLVEMHSNSQLPMIENATNVLRWCEDVTFRAWYLKEHCALQNAQQIQHRGRCHLLLQPKEWKFPDWLVDVQQSDDLARLM